MPRKPKSTEQAKPRQVEVPGTEQPVDDVLERAWLDRVAAVDSAKAAAEAKATAEATIARRFDELAAEDDPRATAYVVEDGSTLIPQQRMRLRVKRPPSKADAASDADPDLPDDHGDPDDA